MLIRALWLALWAGPLLAAPPTPQSHFGHPIGADRTVLDWHKVVGYFRALERASPRIRVEELGKSTEGRPFIAATIASPATLTNLERYRRIQSRLADPRLTPPAEAERLIGEGKAVVMITCSIHATEIGSTHSAVELAYRLASGAGGPKTRAILDNVVFLLVPSLNPDGLDLVTAWYRKTLGTPFEGTSPPQLYHKYVGHDNNRDWYIFTQAETRLTVSKLHNRWHPQIVYDMHQQGPYASRMFVPPWMDPIEPNIDPIIAQQCNMIGTGIAADLTAAGKTGVVINALYDFWTPARHYQAYHGGMRILSESASARLASPITVKPEQVSQSGSGHNPRERSWNYLEPWLGGEWRLRDIIDYQLIAMESVLYQAAVRRADLLRNFYRIGQRAAGREKPWGYVVGGRQADPGSARKLLETLDFGLVEIDGCRAGFQAGGRSYPAGSYLIRLQQPYSSFAKTLLERQRYPDLRQYPGGPPKRPYDVTAHTLPLLMGVSVDELDSPIQAELTRAREFPVKLDRERPDGVLAGSDVESWRAVNRIWNSGGSVWREARSGDFHPAAGAGRRQIRRPRLGLYKGFVANMDEGWTRWLLEQFGFAFQSVSNADVRSGNLRRRYDVLLFADQAPASIAQGHRAGSMPPEFTGGLETEGAQALKEFAREGGTLIFLNRASGYAVEQLDVKVKNVLRSASSREVYCPGSLLQVNLDTSHPLSLGLPESLAIWNEASPVWEAPAEGKVAARYPQSGLLASGWLLGEKVLAGRAALLDVPLGSGRVILFGMRPQYRGQSYQTFKLLFNAFVL